MSGEFITFGFVDLGWADAAALVSQQMGDPHPFVLVPATEVLVWCREEGITAKRGEPIRVLPEQAIALRAKWLTDVIYE